MRDARIAALDEQRAHQIGERCIAHDCGDNGGAHRRHRWIEGAALDVEAANCLVAAAKEKRHRRSGATVRRVGGTVAIDADHFELRALRVSERVGRGTEWIDGPVGG